MRRALLNSLVTLVILAASVTLSHSQNSNVQSGVRVMCVEMSGLNETTYASICHAMKSETQMSISSACVPAKVMMLNLSPTNTADLDANLSAFKEIVSTHAGIMDVKLLADNSEDAFMKRCKQARGSAQP